MSGFVKIQPFNGSKETLKEGKNELDSCSLKKKMNILFQFDQFGSLYDPTILCENAGVLSIMMGCASSYPLTKYKKDIAYRVENSYCMGNFFGGNSVLAKHCKQRE